MIAGVGADAEGNSYNINADDAAAAVAAALGAYKVMFLTDVAGWLRDAADPDSLVAETTASELRAALPGVGGGMRPKLAACLQAVEAGVPSAVIVDGRVPHSLLLELFTNDGQGTMILPDVSFDMSLTELQALEREYVMPTYVRNPVEFVRGQGVSLWDDRGQRVPRLPRRHLGAQRRALPPARGRRDPGAGREAHPRLEPLLHRAGDAALTGAVAQLARRQGVPLQLRRRGQRGGDQARAPAQGRAARSSCSVTPSTGARTAALSATPQEAKQAPFAPLVPGFVVSRQGSGALDAAVGPQTAAVLLEPVQGEGGVLPLSDELLRRPRGRPATVRAQC